VEGQQIVEFHDGGNSMRPSESRTDRREGQDDPSPSEETDSESASSHGHTEESEASVKRLRAWKQGNEEYR
jgi:hypothetical protein